MKKKSQLYTKIWMNHKHNIAQIKPDSKVIYYSIYIKIKYRQMNTQCYKSPARMKAVVIGSGEDRGF